MISQELGVTTPENATILDKKSPSNNNRMSLGLCWKLVHCKTSRNSLTITRLDGPESKIKVKSRGKRGVGGD